LSHANYPAVKQSTLALFIKRLDRGQFGPERIVPIEQNPP